MTKLRQKPRLWKISQHLPLEGKAGPKTRLTRTPPLGTMTMKLVRKQPKTLTPPENEQGSNPERTKQTGNSRKMRRITGVRQTDNEDFIAKKARSQSREIVENNKKSTDQSNGTENDKNDFQLGESLTFSSEAKGDPKETWGDEHYGAGTLSHSLKIHPGPTTTKSTND
jgi:hypothetical protein